MTLMNLGFENPLWYIPPTETCMMPPRTSFLSPLKCYLCRGALQLPLSKTYHITPGHHCHTLSLSLHPTLLSSEHFSHNISLYTMDLFSSGNVIHSSRTHSLLKQWVHLPVHGLSWVPVRATAHGRYLMNIPWMKKWMTVDWMEILTQDYVPPKPKFLP